MAVFLGEFWLIEGAMHDGKIEAVGVGFSQQEILDFMMGPNLPEQYLAFRFTACGGKVAQPAAPTHDAPYSTN